jgi:hypothetical protein
MRPHHRHALLLAAALLGSAPLAAQTTEASVVAGTDDPACPDALAIEPLHLYGLWQLRLWPEGGSLDAPASSGSLLFEKHPDYPGSVRGELRRNAQGSDVHARLSGDVTQGVFNLDESADGVNMSAVWEGEPTDCGRRIAGTRRPAEGSPAADPALRFELRKRPGWQ